jgi:acyl-CoA thioesterase-1
MILRITLRLAAVLLLLLPGLAHAQAILCFGDSLTAGYRAPVGDAYSDFLGKSLTAAGYHVRLINQGIDGDTTKDALARLPSALATHPSIVILELGANDGLRGQPAAGIYQNLSTMIQTFQHNHIRVLLAGIMLPPNFGPDYTTQFNAIYPSLAAKYHLPLMPFFLKDVYGISTLMSDDGIHPNAYGYKKIADNIQPYVVAMLKK